MNTEIKTFRIIGFICLIASVIILLSSFSGEPNIQKLNALGVGISFAVLGCLALLRVKYLANSSNNFSFEERCKRMAQEIKSGKRSWFLNPMDGGRYLAVPLSPKKMNEMGGGLHIPATEEVVIQHVTNGTLCNEQLVKEVLKHF